MSVIDDLIYDRTVADVEEVITIKRKILTDGWSSLSEVQKNKYLAGMKGTYNYTDLNRVGAASIYVANRLLNLEPILTSYRVSKGIAEGKPYGAPYDVNEVTSVVSTSKTDWTMSDIPDATRMSQYLQNLTILHDALPLSDLPAIPNTMNQLGWSGANSFEKTLYLLDHEMNDYEIYAKDLMDRAAMTFVYCGDVSCGE